MKIELERVVRVDVHLESTVCIIVGSCSSPQLSLCRGVLPWDLTATPIIPGISSPPDLDAIMPYFEMISSTGCSARIRQFLCSLLEPECRGVGYNILPPCRKACRGKVADMTSSYNKSKTLFSTNYYNIILCLQVL